uniref:SH2 domain-containing protein n=1 Tax=Neogobius melanostomus TaxID=47308 RepID=A0A8C6SNA4_9GOBI
VLGNVKPKKDIDLFITVQKYICKYVRTRKRRGLRELISTWFIQTQASLISHNGLFPNWFLGFISRKDAEDILKDQQLGCFLIRLSDKALGYILSYRGRDRFRHFVINQSESGQFIVQGDNVGHDTVSELIGYFKEKPIEPFGEYLTTSCFEAQNEDLYDTIQISSKVRPVATVHALKAKKQQNCQGSDQVLLRTRRKNRTEVGRRSRHLDSGSTSENLDMVCYAQVRTKKLRERHVNGAAPDNSSRPPSVYSEVELQDSRCRSMPLLLSSSEEQSYRLSVTPPLPSRDTPARSLHTGGPASLDLYHLASQQSPDPGTRAEDGGVYAEVPGTTPGDNTYEQIPVDSNPYEPVGLLRAKHEPSARGVKNGKWKRLFPDVKKKW